MCVCVSVCQCVFVTASISLSLAGTPTKFHRLASVPARPHPLSPTPPVTNQHLLHMVKVRVHRYTKFNVCTLTLSQEILGSIKLASPSSEHINDD